MAFGGGGWGGGFGGGFGGNAASDSARAGLPFAGIPSELRERVEVLQGREPKHPEPVVEFSQANYDRRPLTMARLLRPFLWPVLGALALVALETVSMRIGPLLTQLGIDKGIGFGAGEEGSRTLLVVVSIAYIGAVFLAVIAGRARTAWAGAVGERILYSLRVRVFSHLQRLSLDYYTTEKAGVIMTRMTSDTEALQQLFQEGLVQLIVQLLTLVVLGVLLFTFSVELALWTLLLVVPVMAVLTRWFQRASDRGYGAVRDRIAAVLSDLSESLAGMRLVTAHNRQRHNTINHLNIVGHYRDANYYTARAAATYGPGSELLGNVALVVVLVIGGNLVLDGEMAIGQLTGFILALNQFFAPMQQIAQLYNTYQSGNAGLAKLRDLLATEPSVAERPDAHVLPPVQGEIRFVDVSFGYDPAIPVLRDVNLTIAPGETFSLVGPTGAGKSTIAKLVTRFYDPTDGAVLLDGHDLRDVTIESLRRQIGVVPQEPFLFHGTIRDNIAFANPDASEDEVWEAARAVGLGDLLDRLPYGLDTPVHERGSSLSTGERQLLALARAFLARPRVLVLDEATSSLDLKSEELVERALDVVLEGRTAIIIAHRLATAMRADRIAVVDGGRIIELGSHDELVALGGQYAEMYETWQQHSAGTRT